MFKRLLIVSSLVFNTVALAEYRVVFSPNPERQTEILKLFESTVNTLDVVMYGFSDSVIEDKLAEVAETGKTVRLILHDADKNTELSDKLEAAGVDIRYTSRTNHNKFVIVDGPHSENAVAQRNEAELAIVATGSGNFSKSASTTFDEDLLIADKEAGVALAYQSQFNWLWKHSTDYEGAATQLGDTAEVEVSAASPVAFTSENIEKVTETATGWKFSSKLQKNETGVLAARLIEAIDEVPANGTIEAAQNHFMRRDIYDALIRAAKRKVKISLVLDGGEFQYVWNKEGLPDKPDLLDETLSKVKGVDLRYKMSAFKEVRGVKQMHAKYTILNGKKVITGSYNWSDTSERMNWENQIKVTDSKIVKAYRANFRALQGYGSKKDYTDLIAAVEDRSAKCLFATPLSLTVSQIVDLKKAVGSWKPCK